MKNTFQQIDSVLPPKWKRNAFDLSHYRRMSCNQGELVPTLILECVPGDSFRINQEILSRFSPLISPVYEDIELFTHIFKVPYYMLMRRKGDGFPGWEDFLTGNVEGNYASNEMNVPQVDITDAIKAYFYEGTLADYLGYPVTDAGTTIHANAEITVNIFRALAYWLIRDEYYRDQNLQETLAERMGADNPDYPYTAGDFSGTADHIFASRPLPVCWEKDYFTSALPYAHDPNNTSVEYDLDLTSDTSIGALAWQRSGGAIPSAGNVSFPGASRYMDDATPQDIQWQDATQLPAVATLEIMELRRTEALFRWYEAQNRGGHRYEEHMLAVYGVQVKRPRNTPIYLGGYRQKIQVSEVLSQAETLDNAASGSESITTPLGDFGGRSVTYANARTIETYCDEHCVIMGLTMIRPRTSYIQGVDRHLSKLDREDFFIPHLQGIGDQAILNKELFWDQADSTSGLPDSTFGYAPNYSEYKFGLNTCHADMRSSLDFWHCARTFTDTPSLNETFVAMNYSNDEIHRIHFNESTSDDKIWLWVHNYVQAIRPMRKYDYGQ